MYLWTSRALITVGDSLCDDVVVSVVAVEEFDDRGE